MIPGSARNWIAVNAVKNQPQQKTENKKYDNSTLKKINRPVASAARFAVHPAAVHMRFASTQRESGAMYSV